MFGYKDSMEYYKAAAISGQLHKINCPMLYLESFDDPIHNAKESFPFKEFKQTSNILLATTKYGGHCCHLTNRGGSGLLNRLKWFFPTSDWFGEPIAEFYDFLEKNYQREEKIQ